MYYKVFEKLRFLIFSVLLERTHESGLLLVSLESSMTKLGGCVNKLEVDNLQGSLLGTNATSLQHDEVLLDFSIVRETSHWINRLVRQVIFSSCIVFHQLSVLHLESLSNSVNLFVDFSSVMVSLLTSSWNSELNSAWMPSSDTSNLPQTLVSLPWQLLCVPSAGDSLESMTLGNTDDVNHLILSKDRCNRKFLLEVISGKVNFVCH